MRDTVTILEESNLPHLLCTLCDILVTWVALNRCHLITTKFANGSERKRRRLAPEEMREIKERYFRAYGRPLTSVASFKYLGQVLTTSDDDWPAVVGNLRKAWKKCDRM